MEVRVVRGDITALGVDAIVNAANSSLLGGGGVDGAIHAAAGPALLAECRELRRARYPDGLPAGDAVATGAGRLHARWVIHTVGPNRYAGQTDRAILRSCFARSYEVARGGRGTVRGRGARGGSGGGCQSGWPRNSSPGRLQRRHGAGLPQPHGIGTVGRGNRRNSAQGHVQKWAVLILLNIGYPFN